MSTLRSVAEDFPASKMQQVRFPEAVNPKLYTPITSRNPSCRTPRPARNPSVIPVQNPPRQVGGECGAGMQCWGNGQARMGRKIEIRCCSRDCCFGPAKGWVRCRSWDWPRRRVRLFGLGQVGFAFGWSQISRVHFSDGLCRHKSNVCDGVDVLERLVS